MPAAVALQIYKGKGSNMVKVWEANVKTQEMREPTNHSIQK